MNELTYKLIDVEAAAPEGAEGKDWYRYTIARGASTIVGYRRGTVKQVRAHAMQYVDEINARGKNGTNPYRARPGRKKADAVEEEE